MRLKDKVAIITGGASGIGSATAEVFVREGAVVVIADRDAAVATETAERLGSRASAIAVDVGDGEAVRMLIDTVARREGRIDILFNNAGFGIVGNVVETSEADWNRLFQVNVTGVFLGCRHVIPVMQRQGGGVIVNTASTTSVSGIPNRAAYVASKGAVAALTRAMALDHVADNIRINAVAPGTVETPYFEKVFANAPDAAALRRALEARQPMNRLGRPVEIANAVLFLASDEASFVTGTTLFADGGWTAR
jgi:NAD(P)-dependent dehydrogenase (short-subunit alcohol dehydrogenase family)